MKSALPLIVHNLYFTASVAFCYNGENRAVAEIPFERPKQSWRRG